jgi:hypothetical protein
VRLVLELELVTGMEREGCVPGGRHVVVVSELISEIGSCDVEMLTKTELILIFDEQGGAGFQSGWDSCVVERLRE